MHLFDKAAKPHPTMRLIVIAIFALMIGATSIKGLVYAMSKQVSITDDNGYNEEIITYKSTVSQLLQEKNVVLDSFDEMNCSPDDRVFDGMQIIISRAVYVNVTNGDEYELILTAKKTAGELLHSLGIETGQGTILNVSPDTKIFEGMDLRIIHSKEEIITTQEVLPFKVIKKPSTHLKEGETRVAREGKEGLMQKTYKVCYENNREVSRNVLEQSIITKCIDKVIEYGAPAAKAAIAYNSGTLASRGGELRYKGVITCSASAYCIRGRTATGMMSQVGAVAVDPKVIPLGTRLYIEAPDGSWTYGKAIAADTGGSIKGNKVDLYMESYDEAIRFGRRPAKVYILE